MTKQRSAKGDKADANKTTQRKSGRPAPKDRQRADGRWGEIVQAAAETFYQKGYNATTTQDIAEKVGMLKGSLYYYISAKEDLLYAIINEVHEALAPNLDVVSSMEGDELSRIYTLIRRNVIVNAEYLLNSAVFFRDFEALTGRRRNHILELRDKGGTVMRDLIAGGQAAGLVREELDPNICATAINTMCNALYRWYQRDGALSPSAVGSAYADLAVAGLASKPEYFEAARKVVVSS